MSGAAQQYGFNFATDRERDIKRLIPLATFLAQRAGEHGITVSDLRSAAKDRGLLVGEEAGRRLSFLGCVMERAGLVNTGRYRRSEIDRSHGNLHAIWSAPAPVGAEP